jgi:hypothetical protein
MNRFIVSAIVVAAFAAAGITGAFAQAGGGGNPDSGTGIGKGGVGKMGAPPPPPPPPPGWGKLHSFGSSGADSGIGIGKLQPVQSAGPSLEHGTVIWVSHASHRFTLRHRRIHHQFQVWGRTTFRMGHHRVSFHALRAGHQAQVFFHWHHHRRLADRVMITRR